MFAVLAFLLQKKEPELIRLCQQCGYNNATSTFKNFNAFFKHKIKLFKSCSLNLKLPLSFKSGTAREYHIQESQLYANADILPPDLPT